MPVEINKENKRKHICLGILAHVDAGKTTLSEALLYESGSIRKLGRVDHRDAFLDTDALERERGHHHLFQDGGIFYGRDGRDAAGYAGACGFSTEMERTLRVLDYAVLVISGTDGIQGHTETLWKLLEQYRIPTFLFINKMDRPGTDARSLLLELRHRLHGGCIDFGRPEGDELFYEDAALTDEDVMEDFLLTGGWEDAVIGPSHPGAEDFSLLFRIGAETGGHPGAAGGTGGVYRRENLSGRVWCPGVQDRPG